MKDNKCMYSAVISTLLGHSLILACGLHTRFCVGMVSTQINKTKKRNTTMKHLLKGFTLIEIMIVVAIIAILAAVAIPNFVRYRNDSQRAACISNMKQIQTAGEQWLMTHAAGTPVLATDLVGSTNYIKKEPKCPAGGEYTLGKDANNVITITCSKSGAPELHVLPEAGAQS